MMARQKSALTFFFLLGILGFASRSASQPNDDIRITVTGHGATLAEARNDAIRVALQQAISQTVVVERAIAGDTIIENKIMSTMAGYIDGFREIKTYRAQDGLLAMDADAIVSTSRILNFIGTGKGSSSGLNGQTLAIDIKRQELQRQADAQIFTHMLRGFPLDALEAKVVAATPSADDPNKVNLKINFSLSRPWVNSLRSGLEALAIAKVETSAETMLRSNPSVNEQTATGAAWDNVNSKVISAINTGRFGRNWGAKFCIYGIKVAACYFLPPGDYGADTLLPRKRSFGGWMTPWPLVELRFSDSTASAFEKRNVACLQRDTDNINPEYPRFGSDDHVGYFNVSNGDRMFIGSSFYLYDVISSVNVLVSTKELDFSKVNSITARSYFHSRVFDGDMRFFLVARTEIRTRL